MRVTFFGSDGFLQPLLDRRVVQFNPTHTEPAPPQALIYEHYRQAVLANMRGAGQTPDLEYDETEDAQSMAAFESGNGKEWLELKLAEKLVPGVDDVETERYIRPALTG